jgi:hypothetical protein
MRRSLYRLLLLMLLTLPAAGEEYSVSGYAEAGLMAALPDRENLTDYEAWRFGDSAVTRLTFEAAPSSGMTARIEGEYRYTAGYANPLVRYSATGLPDDPRVTLAESLPGADLHGGFVLDHAWVSAVWGAAEIAAGKMPLSRGSAWLLNPTDRVNSASLESIASGESPGFPALSFNAAPGRRYGLSGYLLFSDSRSDGTPSRPEARPENIPFALAGTAYLDAAQLSAGLAREAWQENGVRQRRYLLLFDSTGDIGDVGITAEAALRLPLTENGSAFQTARWRFKEALESSLGLTWLCVPMETELMAEYIHLGGGSAKRNSYDYQAFLSGNALLLAEEYLFLRLAKDSSPAWTIEGSALVNLNDGSLLLIPSLEWEPQTDLLFSAALILPAGGGTDEFGGTRRLVPGTDWHPWDDCLFTASLKLFF